MIREEKSVQVKERAEEIAKKMRISLLEKGRPIYLTTSTLSSSMYPFIKGGDIIKVAPLKENEIKIGDIIAVDNQDKSQDKSEIPRPQGSGLVFLLFFLGLLLDVFFDGFPS